MMADPQTERKSENPQTSTSTSTQASSNTNTASSMGGWSFDGFWSNIKSQSLALAEECRKDLVELADVVSSDATTAAQFVQSGIERVKQDLLIVPEVDTEAASSREGEQQQPQTSKNESDEPNEPKREATEASEQDAIGVWVSDAGKLINSLGTNLGELLQQAVTIAEGPKNEVSEQQHPITEWEIQLAKIQADPHTYMNDPVKDASQKVQQAFQDFSSEFRLSDYAADISLQFRNHPDMRVLHSRLVPRVVSNDLFWRRYFFRVQEAERALSAKETTVLETGEAPQVETETISTDQPVVSTQSAPSVSSSEEWIQLP